MSNVNFDGLNIKINGILLDRIGKNLKEESTKFVGVHVDEYLTWKNHLIYQ